MEVVQVSSDSKLLMARCSLFISKVLSWTALLGWSKMTTAIFPGADIKQSIMINSEDSIWSLSLSLLQYND
jgi:hypothetical protein